MATGTVYAPARVNDFDATKLNFNAKGVKANPTLNNVTNLDLYFSDDHLITGFWLVGSGATLGDKISLQVVDTDNIFGLGAGAVLKQFVTDIYIPTDFNTDFTIAYPAKIYAGLSLRLKYTSVAVLGSPWIAVNYKLHKVLV